MILSTIHLSQRMGSRQKQRQGRNESKNRRKYGIRSMIIIRGIVGYVLWDFMQFLMGKNLLFVDGQNFMRIIFVLDTKGNLN